jgi:hypothetical protein
MRCDRSGRDIGPGQRSHHVMVEVRDDTNDKRANAGYTLTKYVILCDACAAHRQATELWFVWAIILAIATIAIFCCLWGR